MADETAAPTAPLVAYTQGPQSGETSCYIYDAEWRDCLMLYYLSHLISRQNSG